MIASAPASKTNVSRRRAGRGEDGAAWTSTGSGPSVINSQTIVFGPNSWCQRAFWVHSSKLPAEPWLHLCHGYRRPERPLDAARNGSIRHVFGVDPNRATGVRLVPL